MSASDKHRSQLGLVFLVMVLDVMGLGVLIPSAPFIIRPYGSQAILVSLVPGIYAGAQFVFAPILGSLSDRYGRKLVFEVSLVGSIIGYALFGLGGALWMLYLGRLISGICSGSIGTATAYICDVSKPETRAKNLTLIGMAYGLGYVVGPAIGGVLGQWNLRAPILVIALCSAVLLAVVRLRFHDVVALAPSEAGQKGLRTLDAVRRIASIPNLVAIFFVEAGFYLGFSGYNSTGGLYFIERFGLAPWQTGLLFVTSGIALAGVQASLVGILVKRLGEKGVVALGLTGTACGAVAAYFVPAVGLLFPVVFVMSAMAGMVFAPIGSLAIANAPENMKGVLSGLMTSLSSFAAVVGPILAGAAYDRVGAGTPYLFGAGIVLLALVLLTRVGSAPAPKPARDAMFDASLRVAGD